MAVIWQPGTSINNGRFTIEKVLGTGGFGITYKAVDTKSKIYAIKTLNLTMQLRADFQEQQVKFINEAITIKGFRHPHILRVYEVIQELPRRLVVICGDEMTSLWNSNVREVV